MQALKSKVSMLSIKVGLKQPIIERGNEPTTLLFENGEEDNRAEHLLRGHPLCQTRSRNRQPYARADRYGDNHYWYEDIWMVGPREDLEEAIDRENNTKNLDKMKLVVKQAKKFCTAFSKLAVKGGKQRITVSDKEVDDKAIEDASSVETRGDIHMAIVLYRNPVVSCARSLLACLPMMPEEAIEEIISNLDDFDVACFAATCHRFRAASLVFRPRAHDIPVRITLPLAFARNAVQSSRGDRFMPMSALIGLRGMFSRTRKAYETWFKSHLPKRYPDQYVVSEWAEICWTPDIYSLGELQNVVAMVLKKSDDQRPELKGGYHIWSQTKYQSDFRTVAEMNGKILGNARVDRLCQIRGRSMFDD